MRGGKGTMCTLSPGILVNNGGEDGTNGAPPSYPRHSCSVVDRGQREIYMLSPSTAFTPLIQGGSFFSGGVVSVKPPSPLHWGGLFFLSAPSPPFTSLVKGVYSSRSNIDKGGRHEVHTLPL